MSSAVENPRKVWTEAELEALPDNGFIHEVVNCESWKEPNPPFAKW
jgi:hypothetical protein